MKLRKVLSELKRKKVLVIVILAVLILIVGSIFVIKALLNDNETADNPYKTKVDQILNLSMEPYSDEDEKYESEEEKDVQYKIKVNKKNNVIVVYKKGSDGKYSEAFKSMTCSVGRDVPVGEYKTGDRYTWKIVNGNVWAQNATRLDGVIMFQSVPYAEKKKDTLIVKYYNQLGSNCNAYAIRLNVADSKWIMENSPEGTTVEVFEDDDIGPLGKPNVLALSDENRWDPSDPDPANPGNSTEIIFSGVTDRTVERGLAIDYLSGVTAVNDSGTVLDDNIEVDSDVDIFKCGTYEVVYSVRDTSGAASECTAEFKVVDTMKPVFSGVPAKISVKDSASINKDDLLKGIYVIDNNQFISSDRINVSIPDVINDGSTITFSVSDDYGNESRVDVVCVVDTTPPEIQLVGGVSNIISIDQIVDEEFAVSRVVAYDMGEELSRDHISVDIATNEWGYTFNYTVTDDSGLTAQLQNTVTYPMFFIEVPETELVDDLTNLSLLKDVVLKDSVGNAYTPEQIKVTSSLQSGDKYLINYEYEYTSPLGTKKATAERVVALNEVVENENENENQPEDISSTETPDNEI